VIKSTLLRSLTTKGIRLAGAATTRTFWAWMEHQPPWTDPVPRSRIKAGGGPGTQPLSIFFHRLPELIGQYILKTVHGMSPNAIAAYGAEVVGRRRAWPHPNDSWVRNHVQRLLRAYCLENEGCNF
jgi:hypothetical protein